jgi:hypothetical protein
MEGSRCHAKDPRSYPSARLGFRQAQVMSRAGRSVPKMQMDVVSVYAPEAGRRVLRGTPFARKERARMLLSDD